MTASTTTRLTACTRASTVAGALDDKGGPGLIQYHQAVALQTVAENRDLRDQLDLTLAKGVTDWRDLRPIVVEADRRRGKPEAGAGTNIHLAIEALTRGADPGMLSAVLRRDAEAALRAAADIGVSLESSEEFLYAAGLPEPVAGTRDWLGRGPDGRYAVVDIKTANDLGKGHYKSLGWSIQTAIYAHGSPYTAAFDRDQYGRPLLDLDLVQPEERDIDQHRALIIEIERGTGRTATHRVDIEKGWEFARLACQVRAARRMDPRF